MKTEVRFDAKGKAEPRTFAYLRVSTSDQDVDKNRAAVLDFANQRGFIGKVQFCEEKVSGMLPWKKRRLFDLVQQMRGGDVLIVPELSRLGRSLVEVLEVLNELKEKGVRVYSVKESFELNGDGIQAKVMRTFLGLFSEIERDLISARTREGLAAAKAKGRQLGRPRGLGKSKLDPHKPEIIALLRNGSTRGFVAKRYGCTVCNLGLWIKKNGLDVEPRIEQGVQEGGARA